MSMSDPISDMLTRIRNAGMVSHPELTLPSSKMRQAIASVLKEQGYISDCKVEMDGECKKNLQIALKYVENKPVIAGIKRISRPSLRVYVGSKDIPRVLGGLGIVIMSTPEGVITGREAQKRNVGGELLCYVW
jgi:small subunit ribosomal protein S8